MLWVVGMFVGCNLVFSLCEMLVQLGTYARVRETLGGQDDVSSPIDPVALRFPVGTTHITSLISKSSIDLLKQAHEKLSAILKLAGLVMGLVAVTLVYGALLIISPASSVAYWCLLFMPFSSFVNIGERGLRGDRRKLGEIRAFLNQLFVAAFTVTSFVTAVLVLVLRLCRLIP